MEAKHKTRRAKIQAKFALHSEEPRYGSDRGIWLYDFAKWLGYLADLDQCPEPFRSELLPKRLHRAQSEFHRAIRSLSRKGMFLIPTTTKVPNIEIKNRPRWADSVKQMSKLVVVPSMDTLVAYMHVASVDQLAQISSDMAKIADRSKKRLAGHSSTLVQAKGGMTATTKQMSFLDSEETKEIDAPKEV